MSLRNRTLFRSRNHAIQVEARTLRDDFKREVARLVYASSMAFGNYRYRDQLLSASSDVSKDIAEGFLRCSPLVFAGFLDYALGSLAEAEGRLKDGVERQYFLPAEGARAGQLARRCLTATVRLKQSQVRYAEKKRLESARNKKR